MSQNLNSAVAVIGIDIGKNSFHVVGLDDRGAIMLRQKWSRGQIEARLTNMPPCLGTVQSQLLPTLTAIRRASSLVRSLAERR
jgi:hypothetical protein